MPTTSAPRAPERQPSENNRKAVPPIAPKSSTYPAVRNGLVSRVTSMKIAAAEIAARPRQRLPVDLRKVKLVDSFRQHDAADQRQRQRDVHLQPGHLLAGYR